MGGGKRDMNRAASTRLLHAPRAQVIQFLELKERSSVEKVLENRRTNASEEKLFNEKGDRGRKDLKHTSDL